MDQDPLLKPVQLAQWLGTTVGSLAQMRYLGAGPRFVKLGAKAVRYRTSDVNAWLDDQTRLRTGAA